MRREQPAELSHSTVHLRGRDAESACCLAALRLSGESHELGAWLRAGGTMRGGVGDPGSAAQGLTGQPRPAGPTDMDWSAALEEGRCRGVSVLLHGAALPTGWRIGSAFLLYNVGQFMSK